MRFLLTALLAALLPCAPQLHAQVNFTANNNVQPFNDQFRLGVNLGFNGSQWTDATLADLAAGNPAVNVPGTGMNSLRVFLPEQYLETYGYNIAVANMNHYNSLGLLNLTATVGTQPIAAHRDPTQYCPGVQSELFANLYLPIWDGGANGTPVNDNNYYALYIWRTVSTYKNFVKVWEIWNEPDFDFSGNGFKLAGEPGNWFENQPSPCDITLHAPVFNYIRMLRVAYEVIKTVAPEDFVAVGGLGYASFLDMICRFTDNPSGGAVSAAYPLAGGAYFDVLSYHQYPHFDGSLESRDNLGVLTRTRHSDAAMQGIIRHRDQFKTVLDARGYDGAPFPAKHWLITESNLPRKKTFDFIGSAEAQRNYMLKARIACDEAAIKQFHIYSLAEQTTFAAAQGPYDVMGLYQRIFDAQPYNATRNDEGIATKTLTQLLGNWDYDPARTLQLALPPTLRGGAYTDGTGQYIYVLWAVTQTDESEQAAATYSFPANVFNGNLVKHEWNFSQTAVSSNIPSQNIALTGAPVFLRAGAAAAALTLVCPPNIAQNVAPNGTSVIVNYAAPTASTTCPGGAVTLARTAGPASGAAFPLGQTVVTYSATDNCGNAKTCSFTVTVAAAPMLTIACPANVSVTAAANAATAPANYAAPTATTTCPGGAVTLTRTAGPASGTAFPLGQTVVTYSATDNCGLSKTCSFTVTVSAPTGITLVCPDDVSVTAAAGAVTAVVNYDAPTPTSNCPGGATDLMRTAGLASGSAFPLGPTLVTYRASDNCTNVETCSFTVTVEAAAGGIPCDNLDIAGSNNTIEITGLSTPIAGIQVFLLPAYASVFSCQGIACANGGSQTIPNLSAGNYAVKVEMYSADWQFICKKEATIAISAGNTAVNISCPANIVRTAASGQTTRVVNYAAPATTSTCTVGSVVLQRLSGPASGTAFPLGTTDIVFQATDGCGNTATCQFTVTVNPAAGPTNCDGITATGGNGSLLISGLTAANMGIQVFRLPSYTSVFACTGSSCSGPNLTVPNLASGNYLAKIDFYTPGWQLLCQKQATVIVGAASSSVSINCPSNIVAMAATGQNTALVTYAEPVANTTCPNGGAAVQRISGLASGSGFLVGANTVVYRATDGCGNSTTCSFTVTVNPGSGGQPCDGIAFSAGNGSLLISGLSAPVLAVQVFKVPGYASVFSCIGGSCSGPNLTVPNLAAGDYFVKVDFYTANWQLTCKKEATVAVGSGTAALTLNCPVNITAAAQQGQNQVQVTYSLPIATSTCATGSVSLTRTAGPASGAFFPIGTTSIEHRATDGCGNAKTCTFTVSVSAPVQPSGCDNISATAGGGGITVSGLPNDIVLVLVLKKPAYQKVFECFNNCTLPSLNIPNLGPGDYEIKTDVYRQTPAGWVFSCTKKLNVSLAAGRLLQSQIVFEASKKGAFTDLKWILPAGSEAETCIVERAGSDGVFQPVLLKNAAGPPDEMLFFNELDEDPLPGENFYRLRLVLQNGEQQFSELKKVLFPEAEFSVFPNPTDGQTIYFWTKKSPGVFADLKLANAFGQILETRHFEKLPDAPLPWPLGGLPAGTYFFRLKLDGQRETVRRFVVQRP